MFGGGHGSGSGRSKGRGGKRYECLAMRMDGQIVTPRTMPVGNTRPNATIWTMMWIHKVES